MSMPGQHFGKLAALAVSATCLLLPLQPPAALAQSNWLEQGTRMLQTMQGEKKAAPADLTSEEVGSAFKDALHIGTENVVEKLGTLDGFNADAAIHIPLPAELNTVKKMLANIGMSSMLDDLELKLNRAAEVATPKAKALFRQAITAMTFDDVMTIYNGPQDAATKYFQGKMSPALAREMQPIVSESLAQVGAVQAFDNVMGKYKAIPFVPDVTTNLTDYTVKKGMDGIFHYMAKEEAAIRQNPARQTTDLLKRVFGK
jgi:hypothetical protein